ncbi:helix-turn-helix domain-containing protein [Roseomonas sp. GC11]|uniref:helix-turn-helix domain-containing protein n=1 Tax=Roseomonas sp. GC11 TaxID=2950546 RepID=UPI00210C3051|nr:helix-turn-helix transcriptional regulator [Roseomonas sp. GC11]MCQ4160930.1 helix-turn-helix domain-containing protein [Roseomonas sp. GC11]
MAKRSNDQPEDNALRLAQARRLRILREYLTPKSVDAARAAGMTASAYSRMETGQSEIKGVALARICQHYAVTCDYVLTGEIKGLPSDLIRRVLELEAKTPQATASTQSDHPSPPPRGRGRPPGRSGKSAVA